MYKYSEKDKIILKNRVSEFKYQVKRRLNECRSHEDEFKPLGTMNGLYVQLHAYMLVAIPYGELSYLQLKS